MFAFTNFDEHTRLYELFKQEQVAAALRRHGLSLEDLEQALETNKELRQMYDG